MGNRQLKSKHINHLAPLGRLRGLVGLLLSDTLHSKIMQRRLIRSGELVMEPFSSLGRTLLKGEMQWHGVSIGRRSYWLSGYCWGYGKVHVGRYCSISENVSIGAGDHPAAWLSTSSFFYHSEPVLLSYEMSYQHVVETTIGNDVWIGENAMVMQGIHVGDGAIIGSGAVVTHDVPAWAIVVGVPARILKYRFDEQTRQRLAAVQWWTKSEDELRRLNVTNIEACLSVLESLPSTEGSRGGER